MMIFIFYNRDVYFNTLKEFCEYSYNKNKLNDEMPEVIGFMHCNRRDTERSI